MATKLFCQFLDVFLIQKDDIDAFKQKLTVLMQDEILREKFGNEAFKNAAAFSTDSVAAEWNKCLNQICGDKT